MPEVEKEALRQAPREGGARTLSSQVKNHCPGPMLEACAPMTGFKAKTRRSEKVLREKEAVKKDEGRFAAIPY